MNAEELLTRAIRIEREVQADEVQPPLCCYCGKPATGWLAADAANGKRWANGAFEYHCYTGYCWD